MTSKVALVLINSFHSINLQAFLLFRQQLFFSQTSIWNFIYILEPNAMLQSVLHPCDLPYHSWQLEMKK